MSGTSWQIGPVPGTGLPVTSATPTSPTSPYPPIQLTATQQRFVADTYRYPVMTAGCSAGKTFAGIVKVVRYAEDHPGAAIIVVSATNGLREGAIHTFSEVIRRSNPQAISSWWRSSHIVNFTNGSRVSFFTAVDAMMRGRGISVAAVFVDDAHLIPGEVLTMLQQRLHHLNYPTMLWQTRDPVRPLWIDEGGEDVLICEVDALLNFYNDQQE